MNIYNQVILRVPQFPFDSRIEDVWEELIQSIKLASPEFYNKIVHLTPQSLKDQPHKIQKTIANYFSRAKFRCTPLGTFASFGIVEIAKNATDVIIESKRHKHIFPDWPLIDTLDYNFNDLVTGNKKLISNSTCYFLNDLIRYVKRKADVENAFEIAEVQTSFIINEIIAYCKTPLPISVLHEKLETTIAREELNELIEAMIVSQLLFTELDPNTIGAEYFKRIGQRSKNGEDGYVISELNIESGSLASPLFQHVPALVNKLTQILPVETDSIHIREFIDRFAKRFDKRHIPVMEALDPELGVGYGDLHNNEEGSSIIYQMLTSLADDGSSYRDARLKSFLRDGLSWQPGDVLDLAAFTTSNESAGDNKKLPNTLSVIGSIIDDHFHIERIGGHSANQLVGRFTLCGGKALKYAEDMVSIEEKSNPDVIFFDIGYCSEKYVDNINRRAHLYQQELALLTYSENEDPLTLDDLYLSISGDAIILRSKKLGKRMVPRMASAYNYRRSNLPIFRFLYDLAFYGVWPDLTFDITSMLPGLKYYPKVMFKNLIISMPRLIIERKDYATQNKAQRDTAVTELLALHNINHFVKIVKGEENTVYDLTDKLEGSLFLEDLFSKERNIVEALVLPKQTIVKDTTHRKFLNQVVIPLSHSQELYPASAARIDDTTETQRSYMPLQEWLYMELFCHPQRSNEVLSLFSQKVLPQFSEEITQWFFIRYNEGGNHIRLRVKAEANVLVKILSAFNDLMIPYKDSGLLKDIVLRSYQRELERYDVVGMVNVERHFHLDSMLVMDLILKNNSDNSKYLHCLKVMMYIADSGVIKPERFTRWTGFIRTILEKEHRLNIKQFKMLNLFIRGQQSSMSTELQGMELEFANSLVELLKACSDQRRAPLLTDLMHMHINRLFSEHQRTHEMLIYNFLKRFLHRATATTSTTYHAVELDQ